MNAIVEILEAALSGDAVTALRLADEAGCTRFELSQVRRHAHRDELLDEYIDDDAEDRGHQQGWDGALEELSDWLDGWEDLAPGEAALLKNITDQIAVLRSGSGLKAVA